MIEAAAGRLNMKVATFTTPLQAELARTLLDQHDIESRLEGDLLAGAASPLSAMAGVRLMVAEADAERAAELIEKHERELAAERRTSDTADARVRRAFSLALVGMLLLPVVAHAISLFNLLRAPWPALSAKGRRQYVAGVLIDLAVIGPAVYWLVHSTMPEGVEDLPIPEPQSPIQ